MSTGNANIASGKPSIGDRARAAAKGVRVAVQRAVRDFKSRSKYFQYRAYVGAAYVLLIIATIIVVVPRGPSNRLKAYVLAARGDFVVGAYVMIRNDSSKDWDQVKLTINGSHAYVTAQLRAGDKMTVTLPKFQSADGTPLTDTDVRELRIDCSRGHEVYLIHFPK